MIRKVLCLGVPVALGAAIVGGSTDVLRFAKIQQISVGTGHPEAVPAEGRRSYPRSRAGTPRTDGGLRLSAPRRPGAFSGALIRRGTQGRGDDLNAPIAKAGSPGRGRAPARRQQRRGRGATAVDSGPALVERATHADRYCSRVC